MRPCGPGPAASIDPSPRRSYPAGPDPGGSGTVVHSRSPGPRPGAVGERRRGGLRGPRAGLMGLIADLPGGSVGVDTMIFIYLIEEHPTFLPIVSPLFRRADGRRGTAGHLGVDPPRSAGGAVPRRKPALGGPLRGAADPKSRHRAGRPDAPPASGRRATSVGHRRQDAGRGAARRRDRRRMPRLRNQRPAPAVVPRAARHPVVVVRRPRRRVAPPIVALRLRTATTRPSRASAPPRPRRRRPATPTPGARVAIRAHAAVGYNARSS